MAKKAAKKSAKKAAKKTARKSTARKSTARKSTGRKSTAKSAKQGAAKRGSQKRETLSRGRKNVDYAKRRRDGTFKEIDGVSKSLSADRRKKAKTKAKKGYGDRGDR